MRSELEGPHVAGAPLRDRVGEDSNVPLRDPPRLLLVDSLPSKLLANP